MEPKFHQVAMYCGTLSNMAVAIEKFTRLGMDEWTHDTAELDGQILGSPAKATGYMAFNYQILPGIEYELLVYDGATRWDTGGMPSSDGLFISHLSYHVDDAHEAAMEMWPDLPVIQTFETHNHTNEHIRGEKRFREVILGGHHVFGHDIKLIERLPWGDG